MELFFLYMVLGMNPSSYLLLKFTLLGLCDCVTYLTHISKDSVRNNIIVLSVMENK